MSNGAQAINRAAELLSIVVRSEDPMTYTSLVDRTGLARSTASRVLQALESNELLERDNDGFYRGGPLFAHYAARYDHVAALLSAAEPALERIGEDTNETVNLAVTRGNSVAHVAQIDTPHVIGAMNWIDVEVPSHCSAVGKTMYAFGALPLPRGRLERRTDHTITRLATLERELDSVRERGFAITRSEFEDGLDGIAAPVFGIGRQVLACIGVSGPAFRIGDRHDQIGSLLLTECDRLSRLVSRTHRVHEVDSMTSARCYGP